MASKAQVIRLMREELAIWGDEVREQAREEMDAVESKHSKEIETARRLAAVEMDDLYRSIKTECAKLTAPFCRKYGLKMHHIHLNRSCVEGSEAYQKLETSLKKVKDKLGKLKEKIRNKRDKTLAAMDEKFRKVERSVILEGATDETTKLVKQFLAALEK